MTFLTSKLSRRKMLLGATSALALPYLPSLVGESRADEAPTVAKRFLFLFSGNGQQPRVWLPSDPPSWTQRGQYVRDAPLAPYAGQGGMSAALGPDFDPLLSKLMLLRGLDLVNGTDGSHYAKTPLAGTRVNPFVTLDQILAHSPKVYPSPPAVRSVHAMVEMASQGSGTSCSMDASLQGVPHHTSVAAVHAQLFGDYDPSEDLSAQQRSDLKAGLLGRLESDYGAIAGHRRIGSEDRRRLEDHRDFLADLRGSLAAVGIACEKPDAPLDEPQDTEEALDRAAAAMSLLIVAAFVCDRTRVATFMLCPQTDLRFNHHDISHSAAFDYEGLVQIPQLKTINGHYGAQVARILNDLDALVEDPVTGTSYLDNTLAYWGNEDGCNGYDAHQPFNQPVLLAGATQHFKTGRYVNYCQEEPDGTGNCILYDAGTEQACQPTQFRGRPYNSLLVSMAQAMGLEPADYGHSIGDLSGNLYDQWDLSVATEPLPFLT